MVSVGATWCVTVRAATKNQCKRDFLHCRKETPGTRCRIGSYEHHMLEQREEIDETQEIKPGLGSIDLGLPRFLLWTHPVLSGVPLLTHRCLQMFFFVSAIS